MSSERGSVAIWMLGLSLLLLLFGGIALDYWRGLAMQRELAAVADSAAIAAASGIDESEYRASGLLVLDPRRANALALASVDGQDVETNWVLVDVATDGSQVTVEVSGEVEVGLLGVFVDDDRPLEVHSRAVARPRLVP